MKAIYAILFGIAWSMPDWQKELTLSEISSLDTMNLFNQWSAAFEKNYESFDEAAQRYMIFLDNLHTIGMINSQDLTYKLRLNQFGDLTGDEFRRQVHGKDGRCFSPSEIDINTITGEGSDIKLPVNAPASVAWQDVTPAVVTPVKNQGQCGSCWAFSTTGAIECDYAIKTGTLNSLSEQQLVDCAGITHGCMGCNGGQMTGAMNYAAQAGGLCSEKEYPYTARNGQCKASSCGTKYDKNSGYTAVQSDSSPSLVNAAAVGCVSVAIEADQTAFQHYSSGVLTGTCGTNLDHGVLVTGYGTAGSQDYWWVKNSWGTSWGEKGYIQICRNCNKNGNKGECGILMQPIVPKF